MGLSPNVIKNVSTPAMVGLGAGGALPLKTPTPNPIASQILRRSQHDTQLVFGYGSCVVGAAGAVKGGVGHTVGSETSSWQMVPLAPRVPLAQPFEHLNKMWERKWIINEERAAVHLQQCTRDRQPTEGTDGLLCPCVQPEGPSRRGCWEGSAPEGPSAAAATRGAEHLDGRPRSNSRSLVVQAGPFGSVLWKRTTGLRGVLASERGPIAQIA